MGRQCLPVVTVLRVALWLHLVYLIYTVKRLCSASHPVVTDLVVGFFEKADDKLILEEYGPVSNGNSLLGVFLSVRTLYSRERVGLQRVLLLGLLLLSMDFYCSVAFQ